MNLNDLHKIALQFATTQQMPILFLGHGSPMNAIEQNVFNQHWQQIGKSLPKTQCNTMCIGALGDARNKNYCHGTLQPPFMILEGFQSTL